MSFETECEMDNISLRRKVAKMLIVGFKGDSVDELQDLTDDIVNEGVGGIIFFRRNVKDKEHLQSITNYIKTLRPSDPLLISLDVEGGQVNRLHYERYPSAKEVGQLDENQAELIFEKMAKDIQEAGFNFVLGPVVDLDLGSSVISGYKRSYSNDPSIVEKYASLYIKKMTERGILTSIKHFPGHGSATADTHVAKESFADTKYTQEELQPYRRLIDNGYTGTVMIAHVINEQLDDKPATFSKKIVTDLLRNELHFKGIIVSDSMNMKAAQMSSYKSMWVNAINTGIDLLIVSDVQQKPKTIVDTIVEAVSEGLISVDRINEAYSSISSCFIFSH